MPSSSSGSSCTRLTGEQLQNLRDRLLAWYDAHQRSLPWRAATGEVPDPYRVWVSEVMLQQTRVEAVRAYFNEWVGRFPDVESLATASVDEVLLAWEGLGYYSRARNLHRAAREVVATYGGQVPAEPSAFRSLPGVGRYTAGAVMSIAFDLEEPVVDGNVRRVFARLLDTEYPTDDSLWGLAANLVRGGRPGDLNQAVMELGATVCTPRGPRCGECPVRGHCLAHARGTVGSRPGRRTRSPLPTERYGVGLVLREDGGVLIARRPREGRLGGLWEFPSAQPRGEESAEAAAERAGSEAAGTVVTPVEGIGRVEHVLSHVRLVYEIIVARAADPGQRVEPEREQRCEDAQDPGEAPRSTSKEAVWAPPEALEGYAMSRAQRRILSLARRAGWLDGG